MQRRDFLKIGAGSLALPILSEKFGSSAWAMAPLAGLAKSAIGDKILVVVRLDGGNDGLATVLPLDRYDTLAKVRANVLIPVSQALKITDTTALHPQLTGMQKLYQDGKLGIVQAVGYPNHNQSHFRSTDIFFTASDSNQILDSGWLGRYLDSLFPNFPDGYPSAEYPDPPSIQIGSVLSTLLQGENAPVGMTVSNPSSIYSLVPNGVDAAPNTPAGHELTFIRNMVQQTQKYGDALKNALAKSAVKSALWPTSGNKLADQLQAVTRLIAGGLRTPIYVVTLGGFDTHASQVSASDMAGGRHGDLMALLSKALEAFQDELKAQGLEDRVMGLTVSEFGRRIQSNASLGTDHGSSAPVFLFGKPVRGGVFGTSPVLPDAPTVKDNVPMQFDFRQLYSTVLQGHFGLGADKVKSILLKDFAPLDLLAAGIKNASRPALKLPPQGHVTVTGGVAVIRFTLPRPGRVKVSLVDMRGAMIAPPTEGNFSAGTQTLSLPAPSLQPGAWICRLEHE